MEQIKNYASLKIVPPSIMPVVILCGSDYEMGYQYGQQMAHYLEMKKYDEWAWAIKKFGSRYKTEKELRAYQKYVKEYTPEAIDMVKGLADGSSISYADALLLNTRMIFKPNSKSRYPEEVEDEKFPPEGCSLWATWGRTTKKGNLICGDSADFEFDFNVTIVAFPDKGNNFITTGHIGQFSFAPLMNNKGLFIGLSSGSACREIDVDYGAIAEPSFTHLIRFSDSVAEVVDKVLSWKWHRSWNVLLAETKGEAAVLELSAALKSMRKPGDFAEKDFIYATNNYFTSDGGKASKTIKFIEHGGWLGEHCINSISRNLQLWNMFYNYRGEVDLDFAKMIWRFYQKPPEMSRKEYKETLGKGWNTTIGNLSNRTIMIGLPDNGDEGKAYLSNGPAGKIVYPAEPGEGYYQITNSHSFYELTLAADPFSVVAIAKETAQEYIGRAWLEFMQLNYRESGYETINRLYSQANQEYYIGENAFNKGFIKDGNESLALFSRAATYFARAMAHAREVHFAFNPRATKPEEIGLKPYGGKWGEWLNW